MQTFAGSAFHANGCAVNTVRKRLIIKFCLMNSYGALIFVNQKEIMKIIRIAGYGGL
jgi:hypothetical protein